MYRSTTLLLVVSLVLAAVVFAAPAVDLLPSHARAARLVKRSAGGYYNDDWALRALPPDCEAKEKPCFDQNYYANIPKDGYDKDAGCRAMKASYKCIVQAEATCADKDTLDKYNQYIAGYEFWCPN